MKKLFIISVFMLLAACSGDRGVNWISGSFNDALDLAKAQNKPILVDFYSPT